MPKNTKLNHFKIFVLDEDGQTADMNCTLTVIQPEEALCTQVADLVKSLIYQYESNSLILY